MPKKICELCDGTGIRMDLPGQITRIFDPTYTCNGCAGMGEYLQHYIILRDGHDQSH